MRFKLKGGKWSYGFYMRSNIRRQMHSQKLSRNCQEGKKGSARSDFLRENVQRDDVANFTTLIPQPNRPVYRGLTGWPSYEQTAAQAQLFLQCLTLPTPLLEPLVLFTALETSLQDSEDHPRGHEVWHRTTVVCLNIVSHVLRQVALKFPAQAREITL